MLGESQKLVNFWVILKTYSHFLKILKYTPKVWALLKIHFIFFQIYLIILAMLMQHGILVSDQM